MPRPHPSGGLAPALHFPVPAPLDSGLHLNDDCRDWCDSKPLPKSLSIIFVAITMVSPFWHNVSGQGEYNAPQYRLRQ